MQENNVKRKALGKGLEELFSSEPLDYTKVEEKILDTTPKEEIVEIPLDKLRSNPYQPRKIFDEVALKELSVSIKEHGIFQPIIAKKSIKDYEIIAGERRVKAAKMAGLEKIPAIIRNFTDTEMMEIALLENLQRENLTAVEEGAAYKNLIENLKITQEELAKKLGKSRSHITNMIGLLKLPEETRQLINEHKISMGHARILSKLDNKLQILELTDKIILEGISVRELENLTSGDNYPRRNKITKKKPVDTTYNYIEDNITEKLGTKVKIKNNKLIISFTSDNDLNRLLELMHLDK